jgi:D-lyxose ketol-isomerase
MDNNVDNSLRAMVAAYVQKTHMTRTMKKLMKFISTSMNEWMRNDVTDEKNDLRKNWNVTDKNGQRFSSSSLTLR